MTAPRLAIEAEGVREVVRAIRRFEDAADDLRQVHGVAARSVETAIRAPRVSGRLAGSVRSTGQIGAGVIRAGKASVPYAGPIHWGWPRRNIKAQPFLVSAAERRTPQIVAVYEVGLDALIRRYLLD